MFFLFQQLLQTCRCFGNVRKRRSWGKTRRGVLIRRASSHWWLKDARALLLTMIGWKDTYTQNDIANWQQTRKFLLLEVNWPKVGLQEDLLSKDHHFWVCCPQRTVVSRVPSFSIFPILSQELVQCTTDSFAGRQLLCWLLSWWALLL